MKTSAGAGPVASNGNTSGYFPSTVTLTPESCLGMRNSNHFHFHLTNQLVKQATMEATETPALPHLPRGFKG